MTNRTHMKNVPSLSIPLYPFEKSKDVTKGMVRQTRSIIQQTLYMDKVERPIFHMTCDIVRIERNRNRYIVHFLLSEETCNNYRQLERNTLSMYHSKINSYCHNGILILHINHADIFVKGRKRESLLHLSHVRLYLEIPYCWYNEQRDQCGLKIQCKAIQRLSI